MSGRSKNKPGNGKKLVVINCRQSASTIYEYDDDDGESLGGAKINQEKPMNCINFWSC